MNDRLCSQLSSYPQGSKDGVRQEMTTIFWSVAQAYVQKKKIFFLHEYQQKATQNGSKLDK